MTYKLSKENTILRQTCADWNSDLIMEDLLTEYFSRQTCIDAEFLKLTHWLKRIYFSRPT